MVGFSSAAITSTCDDISHRGVSTSAELDGLLKTIDPGSTAAQHLISFAAKLDQFRDTTERLRTCLDGASAISPGLRNALTVSLQPCADAAAVVDKQIRRLDPGTVTGLNPDVILQYESHHMANTRLFAQFIQVVQMPTVVQQDSKLSAPDGHRLLGTAVETSQIVLTRSDILLQVTEESSNSSNLAVRTASGAAGGAQDTADTADAPPPPPDYPAGKSGKGKSKATGQFFSSISSSFKAMTAGLRAKPEPMVIAMCQAAKSGDVGHLKGFVSQGVNINGQNDQGYTPLICAIRANQIQAVEFLVTSGADPSAKDSFGGKKKPPLFHAAECGLVPVAELLIDSGADIKERSWSGQPFFVEVANSDRLDVIKLFLARGCDPNTAAISGRTIFIHAVQAGSLPHMKLLRDFGADVNARDITGQPTLHMALGQNRMDMISFLLDHGADPNVTDLTGNAMIVSALHKKKYDLVKLLLARGADPNATGIMGKGLLWTTLQNKDMDDGVKADLVRALLQRGANPNEVDTWGESIMGLVVALGNTELLRTFLAHGGNPNKKIADDTFLLYAIGQGRHEDAKLLLTHGADANAADAKGRTPLGEALQSDSHALVLALLTFGADVNKMAAIRPLTMARLLQNPELTQLLTERGAQAPEPPRREVTPSSPASSGRQDTSSRRHSRPGQQGAEMPPPYTEASVPEVAAAVGSSGSGRKLV
ncbi:putative ankyrin repeat protein [Colletotrichum tanaceti]|uniref:Putative ankyrin repeat protein n=1 Tax=Colletotrichum tanaceti TaxID=1306861 RepID=A0A4V6DFL9_9PEZI|nr:putative ankyrin repeat protein [Colletotrichum tanaceti]TKW49596.1 putative ankyrin repeat protein [Colletotrichum tanaceti]